MSGSTSGCLVIDHMDIPIQIDDRDLSVAVLFTGRRIFAIYPSFTSIVVHTIDISLKSLTDLFRVHPIRIHTKDLTMISSVLPLIYYRTII